MYFPPSNFNTVIFFIINKITLTVQSTKFKIKSHIHKLIYNFQSTITSLYVTFDLPIFCG